MRRLFRSATPALLTAVLLASCGKTPPPASEAATAPASANTPEATADGRTITLSPQALKQAGIVWEPVNRRSVPQVLRAPGRITANENRTWRVGAVTDGRIVEVLRNVGDTVSAGQLLARMFSHDIHEARAEYARAKADLSRIQSRRSYLQTVRDRTRRLHELKAASLQQLQQAETELADVEGEIRNAETEIERTRFHLEDFLQVKLSHENGSTIGGFSASDLIPIRAPNGGVVLERNVTPGTVVQPATDLFVISDLTQVWMIAAVQQQNLSAIREGMAVTVRTQAYPDAAFPGRVTRIGSELDPNTRTASVRVDLQNAGNRLRPEMYANAEIAISGTEEGIFIKPEAIQELQGQSVVFVKIGAESFVLRPVETGRSIDGFRQILTGLQGGEEVVVTGSFLLKSKLLEASLAEE